MSPCLTSTLRDSPFVRHLEILSIVDLSWKLREPHPHPHPSSSDTDITAAGRRERITEHPKHAICNTKCTPRLEQHPPSGKLQPKEQEAEEKPLKCMGSCFPHHQRLQVGNGAGSMAQGLVSFPPSAQSWGQSINLSP